MGETRWVPWSMLLLAMAGVIIAGYLTLAHLRKINLACDSVWFDCERVARHPLAHGLGIRAFRRVPTAAFGLLYFLLLLGVDVARVWATAPWLVRGCTAVQLVLLLLGVGVYAVLTYAEAFVIRAWCIWCVLSSLVVIAMTALAVGARLLPGASGAVPPWHGPREGLALLFTAFAGLLLSGGALQWARRRGPSPRVARHLTPAMLLTPACPPRGAKTAPYTLIEFGNYRCVNCREAEPVLASLLREFDGRLNAIFSIASRELDADVALRARAAGAAGRQGKYWEMHAALFARQEALNAAPTDPEALGQMAAELGMDAEQFRRDLADPALAEQVEARARLAWEHGLFPLPKFVLVRPQRPPVILHTAAQLAKWLRQPRHWE